MKYNNLNNRKYYKITSKSGCVSAEYNVTNDKDQKIVMDDATDQISGYYHKIRKS